MATRQKRPGQADIKLIGATLPRTGTLSMKTALDKLGLPTHHMIEVLRQPETIDVWRKAKRQGLSPEEWDELLKDYKATVDAPGCVFVKQLADVYPDAKILVTTRDPEAWCRSAYNTILSVHKGGSSWLDQWLLWNFSPLWSKHLPWVKDDLFGPTGITKGKELAPEHLPSYVEDVLAFFEKRGESDRVLVYVLEEKKGWDAICPFLGVPRPPADVPWPHTNATTSAGPNATTSAGPNATKFEDLFRDGIPSQKDEVARLKRNFALVLGVGVVAVSVAARLALFARK